MILEEALTLLRQGKKIRHPTFDSDEYLMGCYVYSRLVHFDEFGLKKEVTADELKAARLGGMSIVRMKGELKHPSMRPDFKWPDRAPCGHDDLHTYPQINLLLLTKDDWEEVKDEK